jgi:hypothetical protein
VVVALVLPSAGGMRLESMLTGAVFAILSEQPVLYRERYVLVDRAGVCLLLAHPEFGEQIENDTGLYFQFPRQLVYPDFFHRGDCL